MNGTVLEITAPRPLSPVQVTLVGAIQNGLPLTQRPYSALGKQLGISESEVIAAINELIHSHIIRRFGIIVRHRPLGITANAMVVWNIPDGQIDDLGKLIAAQHNVNLCYQRPRCLPDWPYNLFCMVHGRDRDTVRSKINAMISDLDLTQFEHAILFSRRCFKQRGARYAEATG